MRVDVNDSLRLLAKGIYEPAETELVKSVVKPGDVVLDVGANIGYYTLIFARLVGDEGKVFAFEPDPANCALLRENVALNGYTNVVVSQAAASNRNGRVRLHLSDANKGDHRIYDSHDGRPCIEVPAVQLDELFADDDRRIDFIKMDIQGAEGLALEGMSFLLDRTPPRMLLMEFAPKALRRAGTEPASVLGWLTSFGYELHEIDRHGTRAGPLNASELLGRYSEETEEFANLVCTRGDVSWA